MRVFIGSDHGGFVEKEKIIAEFATNQYGEKYEIIDCGAFELDPEDDYNEFAVAVAKSVLKNPGSFGIILCRSSHGVCIQANRFRGIRAISGFNAKLAGAGRSHNDANILCLDADYGDDLGADNYADIIRTFLTTDFSQAERHVRRNEKLDRKEYGCL